MREGLTPERLGLALRSLAADLVSARGELSRLRRENRELKAQLAALEARGSEETGAAPGGTRSPPPRPEANEGEQADAHSRQRV
jgi:hypothetical protein